LLLDRIILPKPTFIILCFLLAVQTSVLSQTIDPRLLQQQQPGQTQENPSQPGMGQVPNLPRQIRPDPTQITNVPPGQEILEQQHEFQNQELMNLRPLPPLPPEPDIEFQEFVASSLGYGLNIFGHDLFEDVLSTFAPLDRVPVTPDYLIGPGDELLIRAWGQIEVNYRAVVDRTGSIYIPKVGAISVAGVRYDQLNDHIRASISRVFKNFELNVSMGRLRSIQVFVVGQVRRPGSYTVSSLSTLVNTLFASGGPSKRGSMRRIQLKRNGKVVTSFDLYDLIANGDKSKDAQLLPGDVVYVPPVGRLVALAGSVNLPSIFELKDHDSLGDVIAFAGGLTTTAAGQRAIIERIDERHTRTAEEFSLSADGFKRELQDGDVVRFLHISPKFENAVTLRGNVAVPGRYPWRDGMKVKDLIPNRDFLVPYEYWKRQNKLALNPASESFRLAEELKRPQPSRNATPSTQDNKGASASPSGTTNQNLSSNQSADALARARALQGGQAEAAGDTGSTPSDSSHLGRTELQRIKEEELKNEIKRSSAEINWEYAVIQRLNPADLTFHLLPFNLGKAIEGDDGQNLALMPGDVVTIFSQADMQVPIGQQAKFVRLEGEFRSAGVYQVNPGETLRHLVKRVGGITPQAYLYGSEFTRDSTREDQQRRLDEYINDLEKSIERNASAQRSLSGEEAVAERQSQEGERRLLDKLRQLRATGRIVLEVKPSANNVDQLPDLVLEDGDRLLVPFRPAVVNVIGAVYNNNAFILKPGKTVNDYVRLSGGTKRSGDKARTFVIRADGSTVSRQDLNRLIGLSFNNLRLMPGDTIVVPEKLDKGATLRGFKDWTLVIGQFVIGAAAAKVLFP
jgi:protein involved in polysaccharide export with SLBB domain